MLKGTIIEVSWSWAGVKMMGQSDVLVRLMMVLVGDDVDDCVTCRPFWLSVPLTVDSILLLDRVLVTFFTLMLLDSYSVDLRIITLVTLVIILESLVRVFTYSSNVQVLMSSPEREITRW